MLQPRIKCKTNGLEPYQYLHDLLARRPYAEETVDEIETLLPWNINKSQYSSVKPC
ncbi:transposase domain-containing protein [Motilimonas cestriensis]|uniref:transposase domain-containing protein n=1 Tax=Motilimonas cestriensis TaxID=2742685 RepID=UPI003DA36F1E